MPNMGKKGNGEDVKLTEDEIRERLSSLDKGVTYIKERTRDLKEDLSQETDSEFRGHILNEIASLNTVLQIMELK